MFDILCDLFFGSYHWSLSLFSIALLHFSTSYGLYFKAQLTSAFFHYGQANVQWLLPAFDFCRMFCNEIVEHSSKSKTVLSGSQKLGKAAEHLVFSSKKHVCQLSLEFQSLHVFERHSKQHSVYGSIALPPKWNATVYEVHDRVTPRITIARPTVGGEKHFEVKCHA